METKILSIARKIATPLSLASLVVLVLYLVFRAILKLPIFSHLEEGNTFLLLMAVIDKLFILALVGLVLGIVAYVFVQSKAHGGSASGPIDPGRTSKARPPSGAEITPPPRKTIQLSGVVTDKLRDVLEDFRQNALVFLKKKNPDLSDEHVRANIFFPDYGKSERSDDYVLKIKPGLHLKMEEPETRIILQRGQGVTDQVFQTGEARVAKRLKSDSAKRRDWDSVYDITDKLAAVIHPDLKWIISMPIKGQAGQCIGVMNVDGLVHDFNRDTLFDCAGKLTTFPFTVFGLLTGI